MSADGVVIVALSCRYPDADTPGALWRNLMDGRISFREMPAARLDLAAYAAGATRPADTITDVCFGLIHGWRFDRAHFKVSRELYERTDLTHWLALDLAAEAVQAGGGVTALDRRRTVVVVANTLTGEFSRTALLRLRSPFLAAILAEAIERSGQTPEEAAPLIEAFQAGLADALPAPNEDSLAGGLANTIAGRIANHFDLNGGAFSVDGACASSHVALAQAADMVRSGRCDFALVGAVDLSLDPFELVGFSRSGALAPRRMRVFDRRSAGFWPGEGGAFAVLMNARRAAEEGRHVLARLEGWAISSDGAGGMTRPSRTGQSLAVSQALEAACVGPDDIRYVEAHGTGTTVGDEIEISALNSVFVGRSEPLPVGSVKANIGHAKAAAGFAGLVKIVSSFREGWVPPHAGCEIENAALRATGGPVLPARTPLPLDADAAVGLSGFGFGGINGHLVLRRPAETRPAPAAHPVRRLPFQEHELFCLSAGDFPALRAALVGLGEAARTASISDLADLAAREAAVDHGLRPARVAFIAARPAELRKRIADAIGAIESGLARVARDPGVWIGVSKRPPRIGLLFPGQGAPVRTADNAWMARFPELLGDLRDDLPATPSTDTARAQPALVAASLAGLTLLDSAGLPGAVATGHSLGEIPALHWAGVMSRYQCRKLAAIRGREMARHAVPGGAMARVEASAMVVEPCASRHFLEIACENAPEESVVAGPAEQVDAFLAAMAAVDVRGARLEVSHAFHSQLMAPAQLPLRNELALFATCPPARPVISTVSGRAFTEADSVLDTLTEQLVAPVRFRSALEVAANECDVFVEVGAGSGMRRLAEKCGHRALSLDALADDLWGLMATLGELFVMGARPDLRFLFADRVIRSAAVPAAEAFLSSPCGARALRPGGSVGEGDPAISSEASTSGPSAPADTVSGDGSAMRSLVRECVAREMSLPPAEVSYEGRLSADLHLNSLTVGRIVADLASAAGLGAMENPTDLGAMTVGELAEHITELKTFAPPAAARGARIEGVDFWVRPFQRKWVPVELENLLPANSAGPQWTIVGDPNHVLDGIVERVPPDRATGALVLVARDLRLDPAKALWRRLRAAKAGGFRHLAVVHEELRLEGFAASLIADGIFDDIRLIHVKALSEPPEGLARLLRGAATEAQISLRIEADGGVARPLLSVADPACVPNALPLDASDLILVTGGAHGIGAECALRLAERTGARLLLAGRRAGSDPAVAEVLKQAEQRDVTAFYVKTDISNYHRATVRLAECELEIGKITAVIHAAGVNRPASFAEITDDEVQATFMPKLEGLETILSVVDHANVKFLVSFGSVIAETGLAGEAHYALANAYLGMRLEEWAAEPAHRGRPPRFLGLDWSVWAGKGMGERLGVVDRLAATGIDPIPLEAGLEMFERLCCDTEAKGSYVVTSRFRAEALPAAAAPEAQGLRFVERLLVHTPGVELVAECALNLGSDPYLANHMLDGRPIMPGVMLLEAMMQVAVALDGGRERLALRDVAFESAVWCEAGGETRLRIAALREASGRVRLAVRSSGDGFAAVAARAVLDPDGPLQIRPAPPAAPDPGHPLDCFDDLLFASGRLRVLENFKHASAFAVDLTLSVPKEGGWFGSYCPQGLVMGDPAARDSGLQALLVTAPQFVMLPSTVETILVEDPLAPRRAVRARQVWADRTRFCFDIWWLDDDGRAVEQWRRAVFARVGTRRSWPDDPQVAAIWLERQIQIRTGRTDHRIALVSGEDPGERRQRGVALLGASETGQRGDGAPIRAGGGALSLAHAGRWTLLAHGDESVAVDLIAPDEVPALDELDQKGLGPDNSLTLRQAVWALREAQRKAGHMPRSAYSIDGALTARAGTLRVRDDIFLFVRSAEAGVLGVLVPRCEVGRGADVADLGGDGPPGEGQC